MGCVLLTIVCRCSSEELSPEEADTNWVRARSVRASPQGRHCEGERLHRVRRGDNDGQIAHANLDNLQHVHKGDSRGFLGCHNHGATAAQAHAGSLSYPVGIACRRGQHHQVALRWSPIAPCMHKLSMVKRADRNLAISLALALRWLHFAQGNISTRRDVKNQFLVGGVRGANYWSAREV